MPLVPASHLWGYLLCIVVMCTYQILLIHSTWCLRVSGWDILYCTAVQALLWTCVQLLRTQIKIKHTFVIQERGCGRNRQVLSSYLPKQSFKLTGRLHLNKWRAKQSMKEARYQPWLPHSNTLRHVPQYTWRRKKKTIICDAHKSRDRLWWDPPLFSNTLLGISFS